MNDNVPKVVVCMIPAAILLILFVGVLDPVVVPDTFTWGSDTYELLEDEGSYYYEIANAEKNYVDLNGFPFLHTITESLGDPEPIITIYSDGIMGAVDILIAAGIGFAIGLGLLFISRDW